MKKLHLKGGQERSILEGHLWVFSNQIESSLKEFSPGEIVQLTTRSGKLLGTGYVNPHSLISFRLLAKEEIKIDKEYFVRRFRAAKDLRDRMFPGSQAVREVFSESDMVPGLIVDRYKDKLVLSITTTGIDNLRDIVVDALNDVYCPSGIYEKSDAGVRKLEGLEARCEVASGNVSAKPVWVKFAGVTLPVDIHHGQKTGLFLDQRSNIINTAPFANNARVLDAFCYVGAWGIQAAKCGAKEITFLDSSHSALELTQSAAKRNKILEMSDFIEGDAFDQFKKFKSKKRQFDFIFLDPPSFIRSRSLFKEGYKGYFDLNQKALLQLAPGGVLVTSSCSHHMKEDSFFDMIKSLLRRNGKTGKILYRGYQSPDHPVHPAMPETEYLHCVALQVD